MAAIKKLNYSFYNRENVVEIAKELIGKILVTKFNGEKTSGRIVETEAYAGVIDRASHAYGDRRTRRTEVMYNRAGSAYVYFVYGIHHLFNVVTNKKNTPHAILIRALDPIEGVDIMLRRTGKKKLDDTLTRGPGNVSKALGLFTHHSGISLLKNEVFIAEDGFKIDPESILGTPRIGVSEDAKLLYRFIVKGNKYVSGKT